MLVPVKVCYNKYFDAQGLADTGITTYIGPLHRRQDMTDEELIARLRDEDTIWCDDIARIAADRIEQLAATNERLVKERDELAAAIDSIETSHGLTSNGNLWRFWSKKAREYIDSCDRDRKTAEAQIVAITAQVERLTGLVKRAQKIVDPCYPKRSLDWQNDARAALKGESNE